VNACIFCLCLHRHCPGTAGNPPPSFSGGARGRGPYVRWARGAAKPPPFPSPSRRPGPPTPWRRVPLDPVRDAVFDREGSVLPRQTPGGESFEGRGGTPAPHCGPVSGGFLPQGPLFAARRSLRRTFPWNYTPPQVRGSGRCAVLGSCPGRNVDGVLEGGRLYFGVICTTPPLFQGADPPPLLPPGCAPCPSTTTQPSAGASGSPSTRPSPRQPPPRRRRPPTAGGSSRRGTWSPGRRTPPPHPGEGGGGIVQ